ncbi:MAG: energy transducer TonB [Pelobium sp.]
MRKIYYTLILLIGFSIGLTAQETTVYYRNNNMVTKLADNPTYYIKFKSAENGLVSYEQYCMNNVLNQKGTVQNINTLVKEGEITTFYSTGAVKDVINYVAGLPKGMKTHYFSNGNVNYTLINSSAGYGFSHEEVSSIKYLFCATPDNKVILENGNGYFKAFNDDLSIAQEGNVKNTAADGEWKGYENNKIAFTEVYNNGQLIKGENFESDGKVYAYAQRNKRPEPKGGISNFYNYVASSFQDINGANTKLMMKFIVDANGKLNNVEVINPSSSNQKINALAISAIENAPKWTPALEQGKAVQFAYYMPISIKN